MPEQGYYATETNPWAELWGDKKVLTPHTSTTNPDPGEYALRTDLTSGDRIASLELNVGNGTETVGVFPTSASADSGIEKVRRVYVPGEGWGFVPLLDSGAAYPEYLFRHNSTWYGWHDSLTAIPDSVVDQKEIHSYPVTDFTQSNWPDAIGPSDIGTISGPTFDGTAFGGQGGVSGDGAGDYAQSDTMGSFGSSIDGSWALVAPLSTTDNDGFWCGCTNDSDSTFLLSGIGQFATSGHLTLGRRGTSGNQQRVESAAINDGGDYVAIIQSTGPAAADLEIYFDPTTDSASINTDQGDLQGASNFEFPMAYFARTTVSGQEYHIAVDINTPRWYNDSLTESERQDVFDAYSWYDPNTDAP